MSVFRGYMTRQPAAFVAAVMILMFASATMAVAQQALKDSAQTGNQETAGIEGSVSAPQGRTYIAPKTIHSNVSRVTFYRPAQGFSTGVASISINGHFHAALQLGGYNEVCLEPGAYEVGVQMVHTGGELKNSKDDSATLKPQQAQDLYVRVFEYGDGRATLTAVREEVALPELKDVRRQLHAVSRFAAAKICSGVDDRQSSRAEERADVVTKESVVLGTDALFAFDRGDIDGMTPDGRASLTALIKRLQKRYGTDGSAMIHVTGHADPLGSPLFNQRLSEARAFSVRRYMIEGGLSPKQMTVEGKGASQPVVSTCAKTATPESIQCNKPNRRVVVVVQELAR